MKRTQQDRARDIFLLRGIIIGLSAEFNGVYIECVEVASDCCRNNVVVSDRASGEGSTKCRDFGAILRAVRSTYTTNPSRLQSD